MPVHQFSRRRSTPSQPSYHLQQNPMECFDGRPGGEVDIELDFKRVEFAFQRQARSSDRCKGSCSVIEHLLHWRDSLMLIERLKSAVHSRAGFDPLE
ncbi:hypothetical protein, partial [Acidisoma sp. S159]|uniref:hypothetical protein n=1 Tax=Acidisoma sp. S159 TaxID=1747225 RepID=UPI001C206D98